MSRTVALRTLVLALLLIGCFAAPTAWACPQQTYTSNATATTSGSCAQAQDQALGVATIRVMLAHPGCDVVDTDILSVYFPPPPCDTPGNCSYLGCTAQVSAAITCEFCPN